MEKQAMLFRPKMIIAGASAYPREWDYARVRKICDAVGAFMFVDMVRLRGRVRVRLRGRLTGRVRVRVRVRASGRLHVRRHGISPAVTC